MSSTTQNSSLQRFARQAFPQKPSFISRPLLQALVRFGLGYACLVSSYTQAESVLDEGLSSHSNTDELASDEVVPGDDAPDDEALALLALLEQETELATQTRMNADFVPGMVTVIYSHDARRKGRQSVADALNTVAGFFISTSNSGDQRAIVRGVGATQNANGLKMLVDGIPVNRAADGSFDWVFRLPLEQVERIEVIRGPGSAIHGDSAFNGVVNVLTRRDSFLSVSGGSREHRQLDAGQLLEFGESSDLQLNLSHWQKGNSGLYTGQDNFSTQYSNSPGQVYDHEEGRLYSARLNLGQHEFHWQLANVERGPGYGQSGALPQESEPREERYQVLGYRSQWSVGADLQLKLDLEHQTTRLQSAGFIPIPAGVISPEGRVIRENVFTINANEDKTRRASVGLVWQPFESHQIYSQVAVQSFEVTDSSFRRKNLAGEELGTRTGQERVQAGVSRQMTSFTLQDQWALSDQFDLTVGMRYDQYDDWGSHTSPRLAAVWRATDHHLFKAQYSDAYRPPTLVERYPGEESILTGSDELHEEVIRLLEAAYIYRAPDQRLSLTVFKSQVKDLIEFHIEPGESPEWVNRADIESWGSELEWQYKSGRNWEWALNASYVTAQDHYDDDERLLGAASLFGNASVIWHLDSDISHALSLAYMSEQEGRDIEDAAEDESDSQDSEESLDSEESEESETSPGSGQEWTEEYSAYLILDYALTWQRPFELDAVQLSFVCNNLLEKEYRMPSSPEVYPQGLPMGTRTFQIKAEYQF